MKLKNVLFGLVMLLVTSFSYSAVNDQSSNDIKAVAVVQYDYVQENSENFTITEFYFHKNNVFFKDTYNVHYLVENVPILRENKVFLGKSIYGEEFFLTDNKNKSTIFIEISFNDLKNNYNKIGVDKWKNLDNKWISTNKNGIKVILLDFEIKSSAAGCKCVDGIEICTDVDGHVYFGGERC